ncbi:MAG: glycosyltransferase [Acidobacteria bacterium]|nr:glycosyltransferase [Acidobacteriota bacterium]
MSMEQNLCEMEMSREADWISYPETTPFKLRRRALTVRHLLHVMPGERILELGAGSGLWTEHLTDVMRGENPITAAVFNKHLVMPGDMRLPNTEFIHVVDIDADLPEETYDYIVGTLILSHENYQETLESLYRILKPGGQLLFFEINDRNPLVLLKKLFRLPDTWGSDARRRIDVSNHEFVMAALRWDYTNIEIAPYDNIHRQLPRSLLPQIQGMAFIFEQSPVLRNLCGGRYVCLTKPGGENYCRPLVNLARHPQLFKSTSVVLPCHNEEMNIQPLVNALLQTYGDYIHEIIIVDDISSDRTAEVARSIAEMEPRVKVINRTPPGGVGRALKDGYAAATGRYVLTMDCDFVQIVPELRDLFDVIAEGRDGAIGSRFTLDSVMIGYPFLKILFNRGFHVIINLLLPGRMHDISNNLKLYRAEILKGLEITEDHFAANLETGLKPMLSGYDIREVPISWINRTAGMGSSSFKLLQVGPAYLRTLLRTFLDVLFGRRSFVKEADLTDQRNSLGQKV